MGSVGLRLRAEWRSSRPALVVTALLLAVAFGAALAAAAGAVRTYTLADRLSAAAKAEDMLVLPEGGDSVTNVTAARIAAIRHVAGVIQQAGTVCVEAAHPSFETSCRFVANDIHAPLGLVVRQGRAYDNDHADEIFVNEATLQRLHWKVGQTVRLHFAPEANVETMFSLGPHFIDEFFAGQHGAFRDLTIVGAGISMYAARHDYPTIYVTRALRDELHLGAIYWGFGVDLDGGDRYAASVQKAIEGFAGGQVNFGRAAVTRDTIRHRLTPEAAALAIFSIVIAGAALGLWVQTCLRQARLSAQEDRVLRALGASPRDPERAALLRTAVVGLPAVCGAVVIAWLASGLFPTTQGATLEPYPGRMFDATTLMSGATILLVATVAIGAAARLRSGHPQPAFGSSVARLARRLPVPPSAAIGVGHALESRADAESVPSRSTLLGAIGGVTLAVTTLTFAAGVSHFVNTPAVFGWANEAIVGVDGPLTHQVADWLDEQPEVTAWAGGQPLQGFVAGHPESLLGVGDGSQDIGGTVISGRRPIRADEVALGTRTASAAGVGVGDTVPIGTPGSERKFTVVGTVVLPGLHVNDSDAAALGSGALFTLPGLGRATGTPIDPHRLDTSEGNTLQFLVDLHGESAPQFAKRIVAKFGSSGEDEASVYPGGPGIVGDSAETNDSLPDVLPAYRASRTTLAVLAGSLAVLALVGVSLALVVSVRRRRRELAAYAALGATRRQLFSMVGWQAMAVALVAGVLGTILGVALGRALWLTAARQIGIVPVAPVPWLAVALAIPATVLILVLASFIPAWQASRIAPAEALRSE